MLEKTEGIVLNYLKYRDTSIIVRIYTRKYGLQSYIVNGIRSQKSKKILLSLAADKFIFDGGIFLDYIWLKWFKIQANFSSIYFYTINNLSSPPRL